MQFSKAAAGEQCCRENNEAGSFDGWPMSAEDNAFMLVHATAVLVTQDHYSVSTP